MTISQNQFTDASEMAIICKTSVFHASPVCLLSPEYGRCQGDAGAGSLRGSMPAGKVRVCPEGRIISN